MGITVTRDEITQQEFLGLLILREERESVQSERSVREQAIRERDAKSRTRESSID